MVHTAESRSQSQLTSQQCARCLVLTLINIPIVLVLVLIEAALIDSALGRTLDRPLAILFALLSVTPFAVGWIFWVGRLDRRWVSIAALIVNITVLGAGISGCSRDVSPPDSQTSSGEVRSVQTSAYWNTWFEYEDESVPAALTVGNSYEFVLDLSPFEYAALRPEGAASIGVDPSIERLLSDLQRRRLTLQIKPLLAEGSGLRFAKSVDVKPLKVDLQQIRQPNKQGLQRSVDEGMTLTALSRNVTAGTVRFEIFAEAPGCSAVVLSILDERERFPLDHLVRWVPIGNPGQPAPTCGESLAGGRQQMQGGLSTLLEISLDIESAGTSHLAAAAFHVFETGAGSFVVFVDGRPNLQRSVYAWETLTSLVKHFNDPHKLPLLVEEARAAATKGTPGGYAKAAQELATVLFTGKGQAGSDQARNAEKAFKELVEESVTRPVVLARVVSDLLQGQNPSLYVPLGILGAKAPDGGGAVLKQQITVVQPLPRERYASKTTCIDEWTFGVPTKLQGVIEDLAALLPKDPSGTWFHDFKGLVSYLADESPTKDYPGEGFLLLAHHGKGNLWFEREAQHVIAQNVKRAYPPGSVGVFAACSVAAAYDAGFVQQFNARGVDTLIASPFAIPTTYGTRLAIEFPEAIRELKQAGRMPTVLDLFNRALDRAASQLTQDFAGAYEEIGLEYVLLGNPGLVLCNSSGAPKP